MSIQIEAMVRRADLLPRDEQLEELFGRDLGDRLLRHITAPKEGRMPEAAPRNTTDTETAPTRQKGVRVPDRPVVKPQRKWVAALAAGLAVVAIGVGSILFFDWGGTQPPAGTDPDSIVAQAITVAESFVDAINAYDAAAARALLSDDPQISSPGFFDLPEVPNVEKLGAVFALNSVIGFQYSPTECELSVRPANIQPSSFLWVVCTYAMDSRLQQVVGYPTIEGSFGFGVVGGEITRFEDMMPFQEWVPNVEQPFIDWLNANHPDGFDTIYIQAGGGHFPRLTSEALEAAATYIAEYEATGGGQ